MSQQISGRIIAVPLPEREQTAPGDPGIQVLEGVLSLSAGAMAAISGVVLIGVAGAAGLVNQGIKGLVWCGTQVARVCQANAARRRAIYLAARAWGERLASPPSLLATGLEEQLKARMEEQARRLKAWEALRAMPFPQEPIIKDAFPEPLEPGLPEIPGAQANIVMVTPERAKALKEECLAFLNAFETGPWQRLFDTGPWRRRLEMADSLGDDPFLAEDRLRSLRADLQAASREAPVRWQARREALEALAAADEAINRLKGCLAGSPGLAVGLEVAISTRQEAQKALEGLQFEWARALAEAVSYQVESLLSLGEGPGRNLEMAIKAEEEYLNGLSDLPGCPPVRVLLQEARELLNQGRIEEAWQRIQTVEEEMERLTGDAIGQIHKGQQALVAGYIRKALETLGYEVEENSQALTGRKGDRRFYVLVGPDARVQIDLQNHGNSCSEEAQRFLAEMRRMGILADWQPEFKLNAAAKQVQRMLLCQGFTTITLEPTARGINILAMKGKRCTRVSVGWDGEFQSPDGEGIPGSTSPENGGLMQQLEVLLRQKSRLREKEG